jgi:hypothetical protein
MALPYSEIGGLKIARLVIGSNTFFGYSHYSRARDTLWRRYFTDDKIQEVLEKCAQKGLNAVCSMPGERLRKIMDKVERNTGVHIVWFATPGNVYPWEKWKDDVNMTADVGAEFCMPHQCYTDNALASGRGEIERYAEIAGYVREKGMRPGLSTHRPETIRTVDRIGYDCDVYIQPYNSIGFLCPVETDWIGNVIRNAKKPVLCIKPLGSGRVLPPTGLPFVFNSVSPKDVVCIGMMSPEEVEENVTIVEQTLAGQAASVELQYTRSKAGLKT